MQRNIIINKLRVLINHLPLMADDQQTYAIEKANKMIDRHIESSGMFIKTTIDEFKKPPPVMCECGGKWRTDGLHQNYFCEFCFKSKPRT